MKGNKKSFFVLTLLLLVGLTSGYIANTYAKYASNFTVESGAKVAKWSFGDNKDKEGLITFTLDNTNIDASTLSNGKIAPGTSGSIDIKLVNEKADTGVDFEIYPKETEATDGTEDSKVPKNLKLYKDEGHTSELTAVNKITGQLMPGDATGITAKIYWEWEYETIDTTGKPKDIDDTKAGEYAATLTDDTQNTFTINLAVSGVQTKPTKDDGSANKIEESHVDPVE